MVDSDPVNKASDPDEAVEALVHTFATATPPRQPAWKKWVKSHQILVAISFLATLVVVAAAIIATLVINYHKPSLGVETLDLPLNSEQVATLSRGLNRKITSTPTVPQAQAEVHSELTLTTGATPQSTQDVAQSEKLFAMVASGSINAFLTPSSNLAVASGNKLLTPIAEVVTKQQMQELSDKNLLLASDGTTTHELGTQGANKAVAIALDRTDVWKQINGPKDAVFIFANVQKGKELPRVALAYFAGISAPNTRTNTH